MKIFVAHPYTPPPLPDYRDAFHKVQHDFLQQNIQVRFEYGDERITGEHILEKIEQMIIQSEIGIFDLTHWNPNVTLELGIAYAYDKANIHIFYNSAASSATVPSDVAGIERQEYSNRTGLEHRLAETIRTALRDPDQPAMLHYDGIIKEIARFVRGCGADHPSMREIAEHTGLPDVVLQGVLRDLTTEDYNEVDLRSYGERRGTRYYIKD